MTIKCQKCGEILELEDKVCLVCGDNTKSLTFEGGGGAVVGGSADNDTKIIDKDNDAVIESHYREDNKKRTIDTDIIPNTKGEQVLSNDAVIKKSKSEGRTKFE
uniref:Uncharacterized protein n=1 Tax=viral metagenome TaxID=1070528 RepID=A0A6M3M4A3_9ZZZZ